MVNYCCVFGCGRNSGSNKHLNYYSIPKEPRRQEKWLELARRTDLLDKPPEKRISYRFCSRHFAPTSFKNKHLCADALPTLYLHGSETEEPAKESNNKQKMHTNIRCDNCGNKIKGFRYKCVSCREYDLCARCEMTEAHSQHFMLRIPAPTKFKKIESMVMKWQEYYIERDTDNNESSSDDEPITKYVKNYDSGIDLSEDVKETIRKEVTRVLSIKTENQKKKVTSRKRPSETEKSSKVRKIEAVDLSTLFPNAPEMVFADVNEIHSVGSSQPMDIKLELPIAFESNLEPGLPMLQMKLSEDLSELMMEVGDQKMMY